MKTENACLVVLDSRQERVLFLYNRFQFENPPENKDPEPLTLFNTHGLMFRSNGSYMCRIGPLGIGAYKDIEMNGNRMLGLPEPTIPHEAVSKLYADRKLQTTGILNNEGQIPPVERDMSKSGFIVIASSVLNPRSRPVNVFNSQTPGLLKNGQLEMTVMKLGYKSPALAPCKYGRLD